MIKFDVNKLSVDIVQLKSCTTALQGSVRMVDEEIETTHVVPVLLGPRRVDVPRPCKSIDQRGS